jgi:glutathione S-transferase
MKWPEASRNQGESLDLVYQLDDRYGNGMFQSQDAAVQECIAQFRNIFPQRSRPSSRAAFLFQYNGEPLWKSTFEETLEKTDELLQQTDGSFFCGDALTAADIAWVPFLERYRAQLPCLHAGLEPDSAANYPALSTWFRAMESVPAYACRVQGHASSWRKVLTMAGYGNAGMVPSGIQDNMVALEEKERETALDWTPDLAVWKSYASTRPWVAPTPAGEAARIITANREAIVRDTAKRASEFDSPDMPETEQDVGATLAALVQILLLDEEVEMDLDVSADQVGALAAFLDDRMCVPRDMGKQCANAIKWVAASLSPAYSTL